MKKKNFLYFFVIYFSASLNFCLAQQYPFWTQSRSNLFLLNPAVAGSRKVLDVRMNYRNQWVGFDGSPKTKTFSVHGNFFHHGTLGAGGFIFQDEIGPFKYLNVSGAFSYHAKIADAKLSLGLSGSYQQQGYLTSKVTTQFQQDQAVDFSFTQKVSVANMSFGVLYYNDMFHIGVSANNLFGSIFEYYKQDTLKKANFKQVVHYNFSVDYFWESHDGFIWENALFVSIIPNTPLLFDYSLRLHIKEKIFTGFTYRVGSVFALQLGFTLNQQYQISYSYDISTNKLRTVNNGSHEIKLVWSTNLFSSDKKNKNKEFSRKKFQFLI